MGVVKFVHRIGESKIDARDHLGRNIKSSAVPTPHRLCLGGRHAPLAGKIGPVALIREHGVGWTVIRNADRVEAILKIDLNADGCVGTVCLGDDRKSACHFCLSIRKRLKVWEREAEVPLAFGCQELREAYRAPHE